MIQDITVDNAIQTYRARKSEIIGLADRRKFALKRLLDFLTGANIPFQQDGNIIRFDVSNEQVNSLSVSVIDGGRYVFKYHNGLPQQHLEDSLSEVASFMALFDFKPITNNETADLKRQD